MASIAVDRTRIGAAAVMRATIVMLAMLSSVALRSAGAQTASELGALSVTRLRAGARAFSTYSGITEDSNFVVRDSAAWRQLWERINKPFIPPPALPPIDFAREMVVVAALGARPSAGYDITISSVDRGSAGMEVSVRTRAPGPGCPVEAVVTQPVDLARVPFTAGPVRFREMNEVIPCGTE